VCGRLRGLLLLQVTLSAAMEMATDDGNPIRHVARDTPRPSDTGYVDKGGRAHMAGYARSNGHPAGGPSTLVWAGCHRDAHNFAPLDKPDRQAARRALQAQAGRAQPTTCLGLACVLRVCAACLLSVGPWPPVRVTGVGRVGVQPQQQVAHARTHSGCWLRCACLGARVYCDD
jgi:hypothetical protein